MEKILGEELSWPQDVNSNLDKFRRVDLSIFDDGRPQDLIFTLRSKRNVEPGFAISLSFFRISTFPASLVSLNFLLIKIYLNITT